MKTRTENITFITNYLKSVKAKTVLFPLGLTIKHGVAADKLFFRGAEKEICMSVFPKVTPFMNEYVCSLENQTDFVINLIAEELSRYPLEEMNSINQQERESAKASEDMQNYIEADNLAHDLAEQYYATAAYLTRC